MRIGVASVSALTTIGWSPMREMIPGRAVPVVGDVVARRVGDGELVIAAVVGLDMSAGDGEVVTVGATHDAASKPERTRTRRRVLT